MGVGGEDQGEGTVQGGSEYDTQSLRVMARSRGRPGYGVLRQMATCRGLAGGGGTTGLVQGTVLEDSENREAHANWPSGNLP